MKKLFASLIGLLLVTTVCAKSDIKKEFRISDGKTLDINLKSGGSIDIRGWNQELASIQVTFERCDPEDFDFDFQKKSSGIIIRSDFKRQVKNSNIRVSIKIPEKFNIKIKTSGGGVSIYGIEGEINGSTGGGGLDFSNLSGDIHFSTGGGSITVKDSQLDGRVSTGGGKVLVENVEGDIKASSGGGNVVYKNVKTPDKVYPAELVYIRNAGGEINVDDAPAGADVTTGGGDIHIRSAKQFVKASTGGGDIFIDAVDGWVKVSTGAGDIEGTMTGDPKQGKRDVTISTGSGDVTLFLPKNLSMDVDIVLAYTKGNAGRYKIKSEFDLKEEETDKWDYEHGTPRKFIYGTAKFNSGENLIKIRTVNGNVYLKKN